MHGCSYDFNIIIVYPIDCKKMVVYESSLAMKPFVMVTVASWRILRNLMDDMHLANCTIVSDRVDVSH